MQAATATSEKSGRHKTRDRKGKRLAGVEVTVTVDDTEADTGGEIVFSWCTWENTERGCTLGPVAGADSDLMSRYFKVAPIARGLRGDKTTVLMELEQSPKIYICKKMGRGKV